MQSTYFILFAVFIVFQSVSCSLKDDPKWQECFTKLSVAPEVMDYFAKNQQLPDETDEKATCLFKCVLESKQIVSADGTLDKDKFVETNLKYFPSITKEKFKEIVEGCDKSDSNLCQKAYLSAKCRAQALKGF